MFDVWFNQDHVQEDPFHDVVYKEVFDFLSTNLANYHPNFQDDLDSVVNVYDYGGIVSEQKEEAENGIQVDDVGDDSVQDSNEVCFVTEAINIVHSEDLRKDSNGNVSVDQKTDKEGVSSPKDDPISSLSGNSTSSSTAASKKLDGNPNDVDDHDSNYNTTNFDMDTSSVNREVSDSHIDFYYSNTDLVNVSKKWRKYKPMKKTK